MGPLLRTGVNNAFMAIDEQEKTDAAQKPPSKKCLFITPTPLFALA